MAGRETQTHLVRPQVCGDSNAGVRDTWAARLRLLIAAAAALLLIGGLPAGTQDEKEPEVAGAPSERPVELASLGDIAGKPQVRSAGTDLWMPAQSKQGLSAGDQVRTGPSDRITIGLKDGTRLSLQPDTTVALMAAKGRPAQVRLLAGQVGVWVAPGGAPFLVRTPQGRAEAASTRFAVDASRELTTVAVFDGQVQLANDQGRTSLDAHTQATLRADQAPGAITPLERGPMINGAAGRVADTFDGPILNRSMWVLRDVDPGIAPVQKDGVLHIMGGTTGTGTAHDSGVATNYFPRQSFSISVDVMVPAESELGPVLQVHDYRSGERFRFSFSHEQGYATSGVSWVYEGDFTTRQPFGDEPTTAHTMRIKYDAETAMCSADVDGHPVGSVRFRPEWLNLFMGIPLMESSYAADVRFDNFRMDLAGGTPPNRINVPSRPPMTTPRPLPVLWLGPPDTWESMAVYAPYVIKRGSRYLMYYAGNDRTGGWMWSHIGLATSNDGIHWTKYEGNPVLTDAGEPCVLYSDFGEGGRPYYKMYYRQYLEGTRDKSVIALATSKDGIEWTRRGMVLDREPDGERVSDPNVLYQPDGGATGDRYLMYYWTFVHKGPRIGVHLATSNDGVHFERRGPVLTRGDSNSIDGFKGGGGSVLRINGVYHMWYGAHSYDPRWSGSIAHAVSPDGFHWTKTPDQLVVQGSGQPGDLFCTIDGRTVLREGDTIKLWYSTGPYEVEGAWEKLIGYAEYRLPQ